MLIIKKSNLNFLLMSRKNNQKVSIIQKNIIRRKNNKFKKNYKKKIKILMNKKMNNKIK